LCEVSTNDITGLRISLPVNNLVGPLPASLARLCNLQTLVLTDNMLNGTLPPFGPNNAKLVTLDLTSNWISGRVPVQYGTRDSCLRLQWLYHNAL
jgi:Leucine-rich repeat (LRR) protein